MYVFLLSHEICSINDLIKNRHTLPHIGLSHALLRYHVAGKTLLKQKVSESELNLINNTLGSYAVHPTDFLKIRGFDCVLFHNAKIKKFHILTSAFPRVKKYYNKGLMSMEREEYHDEHAKNKEFINNNDVSIRIIKYIKFLAEEEKINDIEITISGFGLGAERAKHFALAIKHYDPRWITHVYALNDISKDTKAFRDCIDLKKYHRFHNGSCQKSFYEKGFLKLLSEFLWKKEPWVIMKKYPNSDVLVCLTASEMLFLVFGKEPIFDNLMGKVAKKLGVTLPFWPENQEENQSLSSQNKCPRLRTSSECVL